MSVPGKPIAASIIRWMARLAGVAMVLGTVVWLAHRPGHPAAARPVTVPPAPATNALAVAQLPAASPAPSAVRTAKVLPNDPAFQERPFPVGYESAAVQWTLADGKDTNVIRQLAHNPLEYARMVEENPRIFRRQLVYLKQTAAAVFEQAKLTGAAVHALTLPGVDGQELPFEITQGDNRGSSRQGQFSGHLAGLPDSLVTLAFQDGREAFTVLAPKENIFVVGEPREPGQVIVKAIDPNTYGLGPPEADDTAQK